MRMWGGGGMGKHLSEAEGQSWLVLGANWLLTPGDRVGRGVPYLLRVVQAGVRDSAQAGSERSLVQLLLYNGNQHVYVTSEARLSSSGVLPNP